MMSRLSLKRALVRSCPAAVLSLYAAIAVAQTAPAQTASTASPGADQLQEVVVTAQFRNESVQQTPLAITAINALKAYDIIYAMTNGGPANRTQLLSTWMYFLTYNYNQVGLGTAIAVILFSLTLIFAIPYIRFMTRKT